MTVAGCAKPIEVERLIAYWLGELPADADAPIEEHLFGSRTARPSSSA